MLLIEGIYGLLCIPFFIVIWIEMIGAKGRNFCVLKLML
ncbi:hypothetical protein IMSAGC001_02940 [Bacteroides acidifaciens]|uniref:Uncharacterized protein n=1 Tax=Bacteroides acidifaciens TaxID=85831 RepID=A0A7J0A543_9BACE|nr:hypothetical protein IMSAGC001_02940 [Bacteroides acidifaciens]